MSCARDCVQPRGAAAAAVSCKLPVASCSISIASCQLAGQLNVPCGFGGPKRVLSLGIRIGFTFPQLSLNYLHIPLTCLCVCVCVCVCAHSTLWGCREAQSKCELNDRFDNPNWTLTNNDSRGPFEDLLTNLLGVTTTCKCWKTTAHNYKYNTLYIHTYIYSFIYILIYLSVYLVSSAPRCEVNPFEQVRAAGGGAAGIRGGGGWEVGGAQGVESGK